jgi:hypothetical protein
MITLISYLTVSRTPCGKDFEGKQNGFDADRQAHVQHVAADGHFDGR